MSRQIRAEASQAQQLCRATDHLNLTPFPSNTDLLPALLRAWSWSPVAEFWSGGPGTGEQCSKDVVSPLGDVTVRPYVGVKCQQQRFVVPDVRCKDLLAVLDHLCLVMEAFLALCLLHSGGSLSTHCPCCRCCLLPLPSLPSFLPARWYLGFEFDFSPWV